MVTIYGIKNCDVMQKAFKWLDAKGIKYRFHDYKTDGIDVASIENWLQCLPLNKVLNSRSTTYRELSESEKESAKDKEQAIALMIKYNSIIKRPLLDLGGGKFLVGWNEKEINSLL